MRFIDDGVDIPDELLHAQDEGRVVFFCGAGVSRAKAKLPDFNELTDRVLIELGASQNDDAWKLHEFAKTARRQAGLGIAASDQVFQLLRRDFTDADISTKVSEILTPIGGVDLSAHRTLVKLSRLRTGETRIVTTNFDRLFEKCSAKLRTCSRSSLPNLSFNEADWGVVHLHGCVKSDNTGPTRDGFVLSSAEFGDAYLADGWARDFVRGILDRYVAVFVGYSADDPPIRYLLEGLRLSGGLKNKAYAFQSMSDSPAISSWEDKGVEPLVYATETGCDHRRLWSSLKSWSERSENPLRWQKQVMRQAQRGPRALQPHERGMVAHIVSTYSGAQALARHKPLIPAEWLCVFDPAIRYGQPNTTVRAHDGPTVDPYELYHLDCDPIPQTKNPESIHVETRMPLAVWSAFDHNENDFQSLGPDQLSGIRGHYAGNSPNLTPRLAALAAWISSVADQPSAAWWAGKQLAIHPEILEKISNPYAVTFKGKYQNILREAWRRIAQYQELSSDDSDNVLRFGQKLAESGWHSTDVSQFAKRFSPKLEHSNWRSRPIPPVLNSKLRVRDLADYNVKYSDGIRTVQIPDDLLLQLLPLFRNVLGQAEELEDRYSFYIDICSIEPDEPANVDGGGTSFERTQGLSGSVLSFIELFKRLANLSPEAAKAELATWPADRKVFRRLRIWALGNLDLVSAREFGQELVSLHDNDFWPFKGERDLLLGLSKKWAGFDREIRLTIERRILKGPPRYSRTKRSDHALHSAYRRLNWINWLNSKGCNFTFDLNRKNQSLQKIAPDWLPEYAAKAAESMDGKSGMVRIETDFTVVEDLQSHEIIAFIRNMKTRVSDSFVRLDPFQGLIKAQPEKALSALLATNPEAPFPKQFWDTFLDVQMRAGDTSEFCETITDSLLDLADFEFEQIARAASEWFKLAAPELLANSETHFEQLWRRFIRILKANVALATSSLVRSSQSTDWALEALNSTAGNLAQAAIKLRVEPGLGAAARFPENWICHINEMLELEGDARRYMLVFIGYHLNWMFNEDPSWAEKNVLELLDDTTSNEDDIAAIWAGFFWRSQTPSFELYERLKPHLLQLGSLSSHQETRHYENLAGMLLVGWGSKRDAAVVGMVTDSEMTEFIKNSSQRLRQQILWCLTRWSKDDSNWSSKVPDFLKNVWPKQKEFRNQEISSVLCELAFAQETHFEIVARLVSKLITKVSSNTTFIWALSVEEENFSLKHPNALLDLLTAALSGSSSLWPYGVDGLIRKLGEKTPAVRSDPRFIALQSRLS
ncbi:MAG: hypothetical protein CFE32_10800 [Alphaproteobacteria bacterium PA3]|nr:MAG: hypothetical protein CFE32_10800 [Alphaproteobacteria bacterium PA3]